MQSLNDIFNRSELTRQDIIGLLSVTGEDEKEQIRLKAREVKQAFTGQAIYLRGLIELSNICRKNCLYCGVRRGNGQIRRYDIPDEEVMEVVRRAMDAGFTSLVIQSGERSGKQFTDRIDRLISSVMKLTGGGMRMTLSCGEQSKETYRRWYDSGARRYLLRIETTNRGLFCHLHPDDDFDTRLRALEDLKEIGYQVGTGVMIGLPGQTVADLADDLIFMRDTGVHMVGMGPYIEHESTPLYAERENLWALAERLDKSLLMVAALRLLMPDINIAAATALDALHPSGRAMALGSGANVLMPNITPVRYRGEYLLYQNKPLRLDAWELTDRIAHELPDGEVIDLADWGDSRRFENRK